METLVFGSPLLNYLVAVACTVFGYLVHVLLKVAALRTTDPTVTLQSYFKAFPYLTIAKLMTVLGAVIGLVEPAMTPMALAGAVGLGYSADSAGNYLKK